MFYILRSKVSDPHRAMNGSPTISVVTMTKLDQFFAIDVHDVLCHVYITAQILRYTEYVQL